MKFQQVQHQFVAYLRSPEQNEKPADVGQERLDVYRELLFNNVSGFVSSAFPVLKSLYTDQAWQQRLQLFFGQAASISCNATPDSYRVKLVLPKVNTEAER